MAVASGRQAGRIDRSPARISSPDLCLVDELAQELAVEPVQVVDRVEQACSGCGRRGTATTSPRPGLRSTMIVGRLLKTRQLDGAVHRDRRRARAAFGAEEHDASSRGGRVADEALRPRRGARDRFRGTSRRTAATSKNSLAPARIACRMRSGFASTATMKIDTTRRGEPQPLDCRHRVGVLISSVDDDQIGLEPSPSSR